MHKKPTILINVDSTAGFGHFNIVEMLVEKLQAGGADIHIMSSTFHHAADRFNFGSAQIHHLPKVEWRQENGRDENGRKSHFTTSGTLLKRDAA